MKFPPLNAPLATARLAPGPSGNLLSGVLPEVRRDVLGFLTRTAREHGDVARYRLGPMPSFLVSHPDGVRHVLQENSANYTKDHPAFGMARWLAGNGLFTSQGSFWLRQRRLAQPAFHRQRLAAMAGQMVAATSRMLEDWEPRASRGEPLPMVEQMMRLTFDIVGQALFGTQLGAQATRVGEAFNVVSEQFVTRFRSFRLLPPVLPFGMDREFRAAIRVLDEVVFHVIAERRRAGTDTGDLLSMFMLARDEDTGEQMDDRQLRDEVLTLLLAGHETTATALSWVWALLERHPQAEARLHEELRTVLAGREPTVEDVPRLVYTRQVVEEALRLYPPVYIISRKVKQDDTLAGFRIPAGSLMDVSPWVTHRRPDVWERPDEFLPERFAPEQVAGRPRFAWFPFGGGPRLCIGNTFALMEAQLIIATVAQRFRPRSAPGASLVPEPLITLRPAGGLPMHLERTAQV